MSPLIEGGHLIFFQKILVRSGVALALVLTFVQGELAYSYFGPHSTEAVLEFDAVADLSIRSVRGQMNLRSLNSREGPVRKKVLKELDLQIQHLMGIFQSKSFMKEFGYPGILGESYDVRFTDVEEGSGAGR